MSFEITILHLNSSVKFLTGRICVAFPTKSSKPVIEGFEGNEGNNRAHDKLEELVLIQLFALPLSILFVGVM
jgi:hypothetical protein